MPDSFNPNFLENLNCYHDDHDWMGTSQCVVCGERLRCVCGCYMRSDRINEHVNKCELVARMCDQTLAQDSEGFYA